MARADEGLAFLLRYENVAWYEDGAVRILDRRVYPRRIEFITCTTHEQVRDAIRDMVTQSCGPFTACAAGMALAAWECRDRSREAQWAYLCRAAETISHARPTTVSRYARITGGCLQAAREALDKGLPVDQAIVDQLIRANDRRYSRVGEIAKYLVEQIPQKGTIMTQCFGETIVGMMCREIRRQGKQVRVFCPETRPYFQGARLTATVCSEMGLDTTVITELAEYYEKEIGYEIPPRTPFVGKNFNVTRAGIHADGLLKNEEIYNIFDTSKFLDRPVRVAISNTSGAAGIAHWINTFYNLKGEREVDKGAELVKKIKDWVDKQYEDGRVTVITDDELKDKIEDTGLLKL